MQYIHQRNVLEMIHHKNILKQTDRQEVQHFWFYELSVADSI